MNKGEYYENGQLKIEYNYDGNKLQGLSKEYYENGHLKAENNYKDGKWDGLCKEYYEDGQLRLEYNYKDDEFDGLCKDYYKNGQLKLENNYKNGKLEGISRKYYENGQIEDEYNCKEDKLEGLCKGYYENGQLKYEHNYKEGKFSGLCKYYYENGQLKLENNYREGQLDGLCKGYYASGQLDVECNYKKEQLNGLCRKYYENGELKIENNYKEGKEYFGKEFEYFKEENYQKILKISYYICDEQDNKIIYQEDYQNDSSELIIRKNYLILNGERICLSRKLIKNEKEIQSINDNIKLLVNGQYIKLDKNYYNNLCSYENIVGKIEIKDTNIFFEREFINEGKLNGLKVLYKENKEYINVELYENDKKIIDDLESRKRLMREYFISDEEKENWITIPLKKDSSKNSSVKGVVIFIILLMILYFIYTSLSK